MQFGVSLSDCKAITRDLKRSHTPRYDSESVAEILGGQGGRSPPHFLRRGGSAPPLFLRTEQFNPKLELFLAIHQRMEVAFNYRVFIVVPMCHPLISLCSS